MKEFTSFLSFIGNHIEVRVWSRCDHENYVWKRLCKIARTVSPIFPIVGPIYHTDGCVPDIIPKGITRLYNIETENQIRAGRGSFGFGLGWNIHIPHRRNSELI